MMKKLDVTPTSTIKDLRRETEEVQEYVEEKIPSMEKKIEKIRRNLTRENPRALETLENIEEEVEVSEDFFTGTNSMVRGYMRLLQKLEEEMEKGVMLKDIPPGSDKANVRGIAKVLNSVLEHLEVLEGSLISLEEVG